MAAAGLVYQCFQKNQKNQTIQLFFVRFGWAGVKYLKSDEFVSLADKKAGSGCQLIKICIIFADNINDIDLSELKFKGYEEKIVDGPGGCAGRDNSG